MYIRSKTPSVFTFTAPELAMYHVNVCDILDVDQPVKRSRCGGAGLVCLESLGFVMFAIWIILATSLLEAGSCRSVDTKNVLIAR